MKLLESLSFRLHSIFAKQWQRHFVKQVASKERPEWMLKRIQHDLAPFSKTGISKKRLDDTLRTIQAKDHLICVRYRIENNRLLSQHKASCRRFQWITAALSVICKNAPLPDMDFILCLEDAIDRVDFPGPVLAFAKHIDSHCVVLMPDMDALSPRIHKLLYDVKQGAKLYPWEQKQDKTFWRGATTGTVFSEKTFLDLPRSRAVTASLASPHLIDARFTKLVQSTDADLIQRHYASYFSSSVSIKEHLKYKYQLLIDGNTCAYSRAYWQLFSNCAILKQASDNIQWFYDLLQPYTHYIPLKHDMSDLEEKIFWAKEHDSDVRAMVERTQQMAHACLNPSNVHLYLYLLLLEYDRL